ncbi:hypothetical protein [Streptomyces sp. NPDC001568]|uniref:hypothetical protein n=1 Tax=Streptomyces sp. NPDC001568 TaxID=3364588 RepID=UPI0036B357A1
MNAFTAVRENGSVQDDDVAMGVVAGLLARLHAVPVDLDRGRAADWTLARLLQNALWDIEDGRTAIDPSQTAVAEAPAPHR